MSKKVKLKRLDLIIEFKEPDYKDRIQLQSLINKDRSILDEWLEKTMFKNTVNQDQFSKSIFDKNLNDDEKFGIIKGYEGILIKQIDEISTRMEESDFLDLSYED